MVMVIKNLNINKSLLGDASLAASQIKQLNILARESTIRKCIRKLG
jgi:hypothetical protein